MRKALVIGVNDYPQAPLRGCINDMEAVASLLEEHEDGSRNFFVERCPDCPSAQYARKKIEELFKNNDDMALLYFSGHGSLTNEGGKLVFPMDLDTISGSWEGLHMADILEIVNHSPVRNKMIILDCCHSGCFGEINEQHLTTITSGVSILSACRDQESALEEDGQGLFTEQFCNALSGGAADLCGNITIGGIYAFIDRTFGAWQQRPTFKTNVTQFAPIRKCNPQIDSKILRELPSLFYSPLSEFWLDPSFEPSNSPAQQHHVIEPYANEMNTRRFAMLQALESVGLVEPVSEQHMYYAAMNSKSCKLTSLGRYYWQLAKDKNF